MERGALPIHPFGVPGAVASVGRRWSLARAVIDPLAGAAAYLAVLRAFDEQVRQDDLMLMVLAFFVAFPGVVSFRRFSSEIATNVLLGWMKVVTGVGLLWAGKLYLGHGFGAEQAVVLTWLFTAPCALLLVHVASPRIAPLLWPLYPTTRVVVVGVNKVAQRIEQLINDREAEGQRFIGYFDDRGPARLGDCGPVTLLGPMSHVSEFVKKQSIDAIYISMPMTQGPRVVGLLESLQDTTASIYFVPDIFVANLIQGRVTTLAGLPVLSICDTPFVGTAGTVKRAIDLVLSVGALPLVLPLMLAVAVAIRATSPGPIFFKQRRYGLDGKEILVWKFRTMTTLEDGASTYTQVTRSDSRVTPVGRILRKTSLDELPQIFNVLAGSMSLVGPRPHALAVNEQYRKLIPGYMVRHKVRPGITGWAQVNGCRGGDDLDSMRRRTEYDLAYLRTWSLSLDLLIILKTVKMLIVGDKLAY